MEVAVFPKWRRPNSARDSSSDLPRRLNNSATTRSRAPRGRMEDLKKAGGEVGRACRAPPTYKKRFLEAGLAKRTLGNRPKELSSSPIAGSRSKTHRARVCEWCHLLGLRPRKGSLGVLAAAAHRPAPNPKCRPRRSRC